MNATASILPGGQWGPKGPRDRAGHHERPAIWAVVIHDDDEHTFPYCIELLQRVFRFDDRTAYQLTSEIHSQGKAVIWSGSRELAELKRNQICEFQPSRAASATARRLREFPFPLKVTLEPEFHAFNEEEGAFECK